MFKGDETGLRVAEILKQKKAAGLDVRVIVDAFSNPWLQTQWMYFDLKQNGIEVEGYEAMALQWLNEVPMPTLTPHTDPDALDKRFHEKMWIIDGETDHAHRRDRRAQHRQRVLPRRTRTIPTRPGATRTSSLRGAIVRDLVTAFDRNFDYFVGVKKSRGIFNTNLYWDATRTVLDKTGKLPIQLHDGLRKSSQNVAALEARAAGTRLPRRHVPVPAESAAPARRPTSSRPTSS